MIGWQLMDLSSSLRSISIERSARVLGAQQGFRLSQSGHALSDLDQSGDQAFATKVAPNRCAQSAPLPRNKAVEAQVLVMSGIVAEGQQR
jgi:hypothetical protein